MRTLIKTLLFLIGGLCLASGCTKTVVKRQFLASPAPGPSAAPQPHPQPTAQGTSSGGGGFKNESAEYILDRASKELAQSLRAASPELVAALPTGWSNERMAKLIERLERQPGQPAQRYGKPLTMDYRKDAKGAERIIVPQGYYDRMAPVVASVLSDEHLSPFLIETKVRLLHEVAHFLGIGVTEQTDYQARYWAILVLNVMTFDNLVCRTPMDQTPSTYPPKVKTAEAIQRIKNHHPETLQRELSFYDDKDFAWILNRPTGKGILYLPEREFAERFQPSQLTNSSGALPDWKFDWSNVMDMWDDAKADRSESDEVFWDSRKAGDFLPRLALRTNFALHYPAASLLSKEVTVHDWQLKKVGPDQSLRFEAAQRKTDSEYFYLEFEGMKDPSTQQELIPAKLGFNLKNYRAVMNLQHLGSRQYEGEIEFSYDLEFDGNQVEPPIKVEAPTTTIQGKFPVQCRSTLRPTKKAFVDDWETAVKEIADRNINDPALRSLLTTISSY